MRAGGWPPGTGGIGHAQSQGWQAANCSTEWQALAEASEAVEARAGPESFRGR